jgi:uncharacterized protein DUF397
VNRADLEWRKSSRSNDSASGSCVEIAFQPLVVAVRDSKNASGPTLAFPSASWGAFRADLHSQ